MPAKKKSSKGSKRTPAKGKKRIAAATKKRSDSLGATRAKKSATRTATERGKKQIAATRSALQVFTGIVRISSNQSILNGTLLIRAGVADFPSSVGAATQYLLNAGIGDGDDISVSGQQTSVEYGGSTINVIVMNSAQKS